MRRRWLMALTGLLLAAPLGVRAEQSETALMINGLDFARKESGLPVGSSWLLEKSHRMACGFEVADEGVYRFLLSVRGSEAKGVWPRFTLRLNGAVLAETEADRPDWRAHSYSAKLGPGPQVVEIELLNALADPAQPRTLQVLGLVVLPPPGSAAVQVLDASSFARHEAAREDELLAAADQRIRRLRAGALALVVADTEGRPLADVPVTVRLQRHAFDFGVQASAAIFDGRAAEDLRSAWIRFVEPRFRSLSTAELLAWPYQQPQPEVHNDKPLEVLLAWAGAKRMAVHGDGLFVERAGSVPDWARALPPDEFRRAALQRARTMARRHRNAVVQWNAISGTVPGGVFREGLGVSSYRQLLHELKAPAPQASLSVDADAALGGESLEAYRFVIQELLREGAPLDVIGLRAHLATVPAPSRVQEVLDALAEFKLPLQVTHLTAAADREGAEAIALVARMAFAHPAVERICFGALLPGSDASQGALLNADGSPNALGEAVDRLLSREWGAPQVLRTDEAGRVTATVMQGVHEVAIEAAGWLPVRQSVEVGSAGKLVDVSLQPKPAEQNPAGPIPSPAVEAAPAAPPAPEAKPPGEATEDKPAAPEKKPRTRRSIFTERAPPPAKPPTPRRQELDEPIGR